MQLFLISGFLGSGKTTSIAHTCQQLLSANIKIAVITNDQGLQQVDSAYMKSLRLPTGEVAEGCFCCRFDELTQNIDKLANAAQPEIIFAETVGSCTDLVATVARPLKEKYADLDIVVCTFADAYLLHSLINGSSSFIDASVQYIFRKQLEEADIIVLNKCDLLHDEGLAELQLVLAGEYPGKKIHCQDAYSTTDITQWIAVLKSLSIPAQRKSLDMDYDLYAKGEAMLAWLDMKVSVHSQKLPAIKAALSLAGIIDHKIRDAYLTTGHLKFLFEDGHNTAKLSFTTTAIKQQTNGITLSDARHIDVLINARVQTDPSTLLQIVRESIETAMTNTGCRIVVHDSAAFKPGYPKPLHRMA